MRDDIRPRPVTRAYLERAALHYLERYASSSENLRRILANKARRRLGPEVSLTEDIADLISAVVEKLVEGGFIDDRSFAEAKVSSLTRRGTSTRFIRQKLRAKGVSEEHAEAALAEEEPDELALARRYAQRKRLGPWRTRPAADAREKDLASLCRAGFPYAVARAALEGDAD
ncbi:regulatory protein RecX [Enterovirga sp. CN4-39]|uniref:regulatory protein RecX n=1 Tax=Enterovirga sp. CN4-39 TaxID=3400910 RepID=UPI003C02E342